MGALVELWAVPEAQALGWALVHFVWQGALLALVLAALLSLRLFPTPRSRYVVCLGFLGAMAALPLVTFWCVSGPALEVAETVEFEETLAGTGAHAQSPAGVAVPPVQVADDFVQPTAISTSARPAYVPPLHQRVASTWRTCRTMLAPWVPWCVVAWFVGVLVLAVRNIMEWTLVHRLRSRGVAPAPPWVERAVGGLCLRMGVRRAVACFESSRLTVPSTLGWLKPVILLPASSLLGLDAVQLEAILAHELAHIRRHDYLVNLIQTCVETGLFYHPAVWWLSRRIRLEREQCCDDLAIQACESEVVYIEALAKVEALRHSPAFAMAAGSSLLVRIRRLAQPAAVRPARLSRGLAGLAIELGGCALLFGANLPVLFAQESGQAPGARTLNFPEWSMGQILVRKWGSDWDAAWSTFQPATGAVDIPAGMEVQLVVDNNAVTDLSPLSYLGAQDLQAISFRRTEVQDSQLANLEGLELRELDLELTEVTNGALEYVGSMTTLERLSVGRTNVTNEGMGQISELTGLRWLDLNLTGVDDAGLAQLAGLENLEYLDLWRAGISDEGLRVIGAFQNLRVLGMEETDITDAGLAQLLGLVKLQTLNLESTAIGDEGIAYLAALPSLRELSVKNTRITDRAIPLILEQMHLTGLRVPGQIGPQMRALLADRGLWHGSSRDPLKFRVRDASNGRPVAGAKIDLKFHDIGYTDIKPGQMWTDDSGEISYYANWNHQADVTAYAEGYTPTQKTWDFSTSPEVTLELHRAQTIGGYVVDETGEAVSGVKVSLAILGKRDYQRNALGAHTEETAEDGAWRCPDAPTDLSDFWIELTHPDYAATRYTDQDISAARLRAGTERLVIQRGIDVPGTVADAQGQPIAGASVVVLAERRSDLLGATEHAAQTGEDGSFQLANQPAGTVQLKVNAGGYLPRVEEVTFAANMAPLSFTLEVGGILNGVVVNGKGKPLEGVSIATPFDWDPGTIDHVNPSWSTATDAQGRFSWDEAPKDAVQLRFSKAGYRQLEQELAASAEEHVVVLMEEAAPVMATGVVRDGESGAPVRDFKVTARYEEGGAQFARVHDAEDGKYSINVRHGGKAFTLNVEADGYFVESSPTIRMADGDAEYDFALRPAPRRSGIVKTPDGQPVAGALYAVAMPLKEMRFGDLLEVKNGSLDEQDEDRVKQTDPEGRFSVAVREVPAELVITHESGFARINLEGKEEESEVILRPWARVEGVARIETKSAANTPIYFQLENPWDAAFAIVTYKSQTNDEGRFEVRRVFPGHAWVTCTTLDRGRGLVSAWTSKYVVVPEGETVQVQLGGTGRPVKGRVLIPEERRDQIALTSVSSGRISERYAIAWPEESETWSEEEKTQWMNAWFRTEEGKRSVRHQNAYGFILDESGAFEIPDVVPGPYQLTIYLKRVVDGKLVSDYPIATKLEHEFDMPEIDGGHSEEVLDLGTLTVDWTGMAP